MEQTQCDALHRLLCDVLDQENKFRPATNDEVSMCNNLDSIVLLLIVHCVWCR